MNSRLQNILIILTSVSMESSHLVIFSTSGKFITKFNVLQGSIGTIIIFRQCVSQKHGFLFFEKF